MFRFAGKLCLAGILGTGLMLAIVPAVARAQSFSFGISSGHGHGHGHHHHHHHGWHGPYCGPRWYGPAFGVVYAPAPIIQERVVYVEPRVTAVAPPPLATYSAPSATTNALPAAAPVTDDRIVIRNVSGSNLAVAFLVDNQDVELADGGARTFIGKSRRTVTYDRGGRFGSTQQELAAGHYEFRITPSGWDLVRKPDLPATSRTAIRSNSLPDESISR